MSVPKYLPEGTMVVPLKSPLDDYPQVSRIPGIDALIGQVCAVRGFNGYDYRVGFSHHRGYWFSPDMLRLAEVIKEK